MPSQIPGKGNYNFIDLFAGAGGLSEPKRHEIRSMLFFPAQDSTLQTGIRREPSCKGSEPFPH